MQIVSINPQTGGRIDAVGADPRNDGSRAHPRTDAPRKSLVGHAATARKGSEIQSAFAGFGLKCLQRGDVRVPLDECRYRAKALHSRAVQTPYVIADVSIVGIDADLAVLNTSDRMARQVEFLDDGSRNSVQVAVGIESMIHGVDVDIVDVQQYCAAGLLCERSQKFPFGHF